MRVFLTGATGYIGAAVAQKLQAAGHTIVGLARNEAAVQKLKTQQIEPCLGDLRTPQNLTQVARHSDGIVHTAFIHDFRNWVNAVQIDRHFITTIANAIAGSEKPLITTSDTSVLGDTGRAIASENYPTANEAISTCRAQVEKDVIQAAQLNIRTVVLRLPIYVYGGTGGTSFMAMQFQAACEMGVAQYIASGKQLISAAQVDDVAQLYVLALERAAAGSLYHAATESGISAFAIAKAIANIAQCDTESICFEEASFNWGDTLAQLLSINNQTSAKKAIKQLGWQPQVGRSLLQEIESGWYGTLCHNFDDLNRVEMLKLLYKKSPSLRPNNSFSREQIERHNGGNRPYSQTF